MEVYNIKKETLKLLLEVLYINFQIKSSTLSKEVE